MKEEPGFSPHVSAQLSAREGSRGIAVPTPAFPMVSSRRGALEALLVYKKSSAIWLRRYGPAYCMHRGMANCL